MRKVSVNHGSIHYELEVVDAEEVLNKEVKNMQTLNKVKNMQTLNKVKGYRVMCNLNQDEMANAIGMPKRTYCDKENGVSKFSVEDLKKIRDVIVSNGLNITLDELVC